MPVIGITTQVALPSFCCCRYYRSQQFSKEKKWGISFFFLSPARFFLLFLFFFGGLHTSRQVQYAPLLNAFFPLLLYGNGQNAFFFCLVASAYDRHDGRTRGLLQAITSIFCNCMNLNFVSLLLYIHDDMKRRKGEAYEKMVRNSNHFSLSLCRLSLCINTSSFAMPHISIPNRLCMNAVNTQSAARLPVMS